MKKFLIAPSILSADFSRLGMDASKALRAGGDMLHFDVMDNHYVKNLTFGPIIFKSLKNYGITKPIDVHLMVKPVDKIILEFIKCGANIISFHPETSKNIYKTIRIIKKFGCKVGLVFNPTTPLNCLKYFIDKINRITLMSVNPGFSGQIFIKETFKKIKEARNLINKSGYNIKLEVDGGINMKNISKISKFGADIFVIGSSLFGKKNYKKIINKMRKKINL